MIVRKMIFWLISAFVLFSPISLLLYGSWRAKKVAVASDVIEPAELRFARWLSLFTALVPLTEILLSELPSKVLGDLHVYLWGGLPLIALVAGLTASILFIIYARQSERIVSPIAALLASIFAVFFLFGMTGAAG